MGARRTPLEWLYLRPGQAGPARRAAIRNNGAALLAGLLAVALFLFDFATRSPCPPGFVQISFDGIGLILGTLLSIPPAALLLAARGRAADHHREGAGSWVMAGFGLALLLLAVLLCTGAGFLVATNVGQGSGSCFTF